MVDLAKRRIHKLDADGTYLEQVPMPEDAPDDQEYPRDIVADGEFIYFTAAISDDVSPQLRVYKYRRVNSAFRSGDKVQRRSGPGKTWS